MSTNIRVEVWTEGQFLHSKSEWNHLLQLSQANALFMSWEWQSEWWVRHRDTFQLELVIVAAYLGELLIGIAPLSRRDVVRKRFLRTRRLEVLGQLYSQPNSVMSEYLDFIIDQSYFESTMCAFSAWLRDYAEWDELIASNVEPTSAIRKLVNHPQEYKLGGYLRCIDRMTAYSVNIEKGFQHWVTGLKSNTRRKVIGHRKRIPGLRYVQVASKDIDKSFKLMDEFHASRWGGVHFVGERRTFHMRIAKIFARDDRLSMSLLFDGNTPISVLYNIRMDNIVYNLQSAFASDYMKAVSLGYLHLGFCIERLCLEGISVIDLLAGQGRKRNYKQDLCDNEVHLETIQLVRSNFPKLAYWVFDTVQSLR